MKKWIIAIIGLVCFSCHQEVDRSIFGNWQVQTRFYQATYQILQHQGKVVGRVLKYDDGTTQYHWNSEQPKYVFQNLKPENQVFVDAISGATTKSAPTLEIQVQNKDTLHTKFFINNHTVSEYWVRQK